MFIEICVKIKVDFGGTGMDKKGTKKLWLTSINYIQKKKCINMLLRTQLIKRNPFGVAIQVKGKGICPLT